MRDILSVKGLAHRFGGVQAIKDLDISFRRGELFGLIGPNGSGKTTLFNILTGILRPQAGVALFNERNILGNTPQEIYRLGISRTFQRCRLFLDLSIFDNLAVGNSRNLDLRAWVPFVRRDILERQFDQNLDKALHLLGLFDPKLKAAIFEPVANLPMIQRRRVEICRALMSDPKLLLLDEPSAGMTREETRQLMDNVLHAKESSPDLTVVIIEHDMLEIERITHRCAVLNFGTKVKEGSYRDVVSDPLVQQAYLGGE